VVLTKRGRLNFNEQTRSPTNVKKYTEGPKVHIYTRRKKKVTRFKIAKNIN
jgi:hypothetical protein